MMTDQAAIAQAIAQAAVIAEKAIVQAMATAAGERSLHLRSEPKSMGP